MPHRAAVALAQAAPRYALATFGDVTPRGEQPSHGDVELNFVYSGRLGYFVGGRFVDVPAGALTVFWGALPHRLVEVGEGAAFMQARVPLATLLGWELPAAFVRKVLGGELVIDAHNPAWDAELTRRWVVDSATGDGGARRICELELEARLRRLATRRPQKATARGPEHKPRRQVEAITAFLARNYQDDISTADIGRAVNLHPNYAMTLFRRECGMSIWQYLIRLRLSQAQLMLLTTDKPVLTVALESGFGSLARFYAAFTRECSISPGEFRKRATL